MLVGERYGGRFGETAQSITWREYDEAVRLRIPVIVLVLRHVNEAAERYAKTPRRSRREPFEHAGHVFEFINALRKGRLDNWIHTWDGSVTQAQAIIQNRLNSLFHAYQRPYQDLRNRAEMLPRYAEARAQIDLALAAILSEARPVPCEVGFDIILEIVEQHRASLLGFSNTDRYNIAAYLQRGRLLRVVARRCDPRIRRRDRPWKLGQGHVASNTRC